MSNNDNIQYVLYTGLIANGGKTLEDALNTIAKLVANGHAGVMEDWKIVEVDSTRVFGYTRLIPLDEFRGRLRYLCNKELALTRKRGGAAFPEVKVGYRVRVRHPYKTITGTITSVDYIERDYSINKDDYDDSTNIIGYGIFVRDEDDGEVYEWKSLIDGGRMELLEKIPA